MIVSMTGFGAASLENEKIAIFTEVKTLNSKFLDVNLRLPKNFPSELEIELRNLIKDKLLRGKINATVDFQLKNELNPAVNINKDLVKFYYQQIKEIAGELNAEQQDILRVVLMMPDVMQQELQSDDTDEEHSLLIKKVFIESMDKCIEFRKQEGKATEKSFLTNIQNIDELLTKIIALDPQRIQNIKERIQSRIIEISGNDLFDKNRFEQEMIYFIEKLDISEEKLRLKNHLDYFIKSLHLPEESGKKLNFISQELGREINTIGSKANDAEIQKMVVEMKEELEKIKEQVMNIL